MLFIRVNSTQMAYNSGMLKKIILIFLLFVSLLNAREIQTVFSYSTPPYVFKDGSGIVMTLVKEALAYKSHTVKPAFVNIGRGLELFKDGYVDATSIIKKSSGLKAYYSEPFMQYYNVAISLRRRHCEIQNISDLKHYDFSSFQNATLYLGKKFAKVAKEAGKKYSEIANQKQQVYKLLKGRTSVVVMDKFIFSYYKNELIHEGKISKKIEIQEFELFESTKYRTAFRDEKIRDDFNQGIQVLKKSGRYDEIYQFYAEKYFKKR